MVTASPRVWLVGGMSLRHDVPPVGSAVRDDLGQVWHHGDDGLWHTADHRHHAAWDQLRNRSDLVEVTR